MFHIMLLMVDVPAKHARPRGHPYSLLLLIVLLLLLVDRCDGTFVNLLSRCRAFGAVATLPFSTHAPQTILSLSAGTGLIPRPLAWLCVLISLGELVLDQWALVVKWVGLGRKVRFYLSCTIGGITWLFNSDQSGCYCR